MASNPPVTGNPLASFRTYPDAANLFWIRSDLISTDVRSISGGPAPSAPPFHPPAGCWEREGSGDSLPSIDRKLMDIRPSLIRELLGVSRSCLTCTHAATCKRMMHRRTLGKKIQEASTWGRWKRPRPSCKPSEEVKSFAPPFLMGLHERRFRFDTRHRQLPGLCHLTPFGATPHSPIADPCTLQQHQALGCTNSDLG